MTELTRRRVLAAGSIAAAGALAGCTSSAEEDDEGSGDEPTEPAGTILSDITVENLSGEAHTVDVIVEFDDAIEHWTTHHLDDERTSAELEPEWPSEAGSFRLLVRLDEDETNLTEVTPAKWNDPSCLSLLITIGRGGTLRIYSDTQGGSCGADGSGGSGSGTGDGDGNANSDD